MSVIPIGEARSTLKVKRSEFIAILRPVFSLEDVQAGLQTTRKEFHQARHICWAYRYDEGKRVENYSDSGEPSGSAGIPILNTLRKRDTIQISLIVVRYFGGIKLGKRGLAAAYRESAEHVCEIAMWKPWVPTQVFAIEGEFKSAGKIEHWLRRNLGKRIKDESTEKLKWIIECPLDRNLEELRPWVTGIQKEANTTKPRR